MKLLTKELRRALPHLGVNEDEGDNALALVKFFTPDSSWTWFASEFDGVDTFYGLADGNELEYGYFSLSELTRARGKLGLPVERDLYWRPKPLRVIYEEYSQRH